MYRKNEIKEEIVILTLLEETIRIPECLPEISYIFERLLTFNGKTDRYILLKLLKY